MDLLLTLQPDSDLPLYQQMVQELRRAIGSGRLVPGARLPSSRELARVHGIARNTVATAYEQLVAEGYLEGRDRSGHYVSGDLPDNGLHAERVPGVPGSAPPLRLSTWAQGIMHLDPPTESDHLPFDFRQRVSSRAYPRAAWRRHMDRALADDAEGLLEYDEPAGYRPLREAIAAYATRSRGLTCTPEQVVVTSGARQGVDLLLRTLLNPGDAVALEEPGYHGARQALAAAGARIAAVPLDERGLQTGALSHLADLRLVYVTPSNQYPTGVTLDPARRLALLEWARRTGAVIIEDDYDGEFRYAGRPLQALQGLGPQQVAYVGTFAKSLAPGLRLGYLVLPTDLVRPVTIAKWVSDRQTATVPQAALASFIASGDLERHLRRARLIFRRQRDALLAAFAAHLPAARLGTAVAGLHVVAVLPGIATPAAEALLVERAQRAGIGLQPARPAYTVAPEPGTFLFWFSHLDEAALAEGIRRLAGVIARGG